MESISPQIHIYTGTKMRISMGLKELAEQTNKTSIKPEQLEHKKSK